MELDDTLAASGESAAPSPSSLAATLPRSSVLPRLEMVGDKPRLVASGRPRYEHTRRLGEGGIGEVFGAHDNDIGRDVAVKRLRPAQRTPAMVARFADEVRTVGALEHPNIVPIHDVGVDENGDYYFVMKYVQGETLESIIDRLAAGDRETHARYGFERRVQIFQGILEAVAFAHDKGIVHRDIKPANVMVGGYGEVVLMDWGIAKHLQQQGASPPPDGAAAAPPASPLASTRRGSMFETRIGEIIGTPAYMSPEQARGERIDVRSDIYSLCMLFQEFLCLRHPLADKRTLDDVVRAVCEEPVPHASFVSHPQQQSAPAELGWFVQKGIQKDPAKRYQTVREMIERLDRRAEGLFPIQCHVTFMKRTSHAWLRFVDRHPIGGLIAIVAATGFVVASIVLFVSRALHG